MERRYVLLSKKMSLALRHDPGRFGLFMDREGWVNLRSFLCAMACSQQDLQYIIDNSDKQRFELRGNKIRAYYGHTVPAEIQYPPIQPPEILWHGTSPQAWWKSIRSSGLVPMARQYVHLSADRETAILVGRRHCWPSGTAPVLLEVAAERAWGTGIQFFRPNPSDGVWLAGAIPAAYLRQVSDLARDVL